jgi:hypothetical protein
MAYIAFASAKGSPGVTTTVAALAATWPQGRRLLLAELDPAGGDLAVRFDLAPEPGLVTLAAAGRRALDERTLLAHTQVIPGHGRHDAHAPRVLPAPVSADQATAALVALRGRLAPVLEALPTIDGTDVLVDCGRLDPGSPAAAAAAERPWSSRSGGSRSSRRARSRSSSTSSRRSPAPRSSSSAVRTTRPRSRSSPVRRQAPSRASSGWTAPGSTTSPPRAPSPTSRR